MAKKERKKELEKSRELRLVLLTRLFIRLTDKQQREIISRIISLLSGVGSVNDAKKAQKGA